MKTNNIGFTRFTYTLDDKKETVSKYYLSHTEPIENVYLFTEYVQIERNFGKNESTGIDFWIRKKDASTWNESTLVSGLRETHLKNIYYADEVNKKGRKSLLLVQIVPDLGILIIDYFKNYNPFTLVKKIEFINSHNFEFKP